MPACAAEQQVRSAFAEQASWCRTLASPLTANLCELIARRPWPDCEVSRRLRGWPGDPRAAADAVPLRLCGGLHELVRSGRLPQLAAFYPPYPPAAADRMGSALDQAFSRPGLASWLDGPPQTNEVGRSAALMAGLLTFVARFPLPIDLLELGASAGLNLQLDRFCFRLGGRHIGDALSPLRITPEWHGPPPPAATLELASRAGVDRSPLDPRRDGERLLAYVWADQIGRIEQLEAALSIARAHPLTVEVGDAADWVEGRLARPQNEGLGRVIMHSIVFQYLSPKRQAWVTRAIQRAGAQATETRPLGWLRFERDGPDRDAYLRLRTWPGANEQLLARSHPHGASISWLVPTVH